MVERALFRATVRALLEPKRLVPILLVSAPLVVAQGSLSRDPLAVPLAILTCLAFVLLAPLSWRVLFPDDREHGQGAVRLLLYAGEGAGVVLVLGLVIPKLFGMGKTFLTSNSSLAISGALFLVGGWGLGRDIELEASLARERARGAALARDAEQAQLLALRAHLDPHFLFNTLNAIAEWCRQDGETAERAVLQLSAMLRTLLAGVRETSWPFAQELELVRALFALHQMRDREAFTLRWEVADDLGAVLVPPLILMPLAENAVKHGPASGHHGAIVVAARLDGAQVRVSIENPGPYRGPRPGSGGLPTVERRLALAYGGAAQLVIAGDGPRTRVDLSVPRAGPQPGVLV
jgi:two-component system, LytTR family, sensor histidine kinase AlgZ